MMNQITESKKGNLTPEIISVAQQENLDPALIAEKTAKGTIVILHNIKSPRKAIGVGEGVKTKVNANIGTSKDHQDLDYELKKISILEKAGSDALMDLSTGGDIDKIRKTIVSHTKLPVGTVPIYQTTLETIEKNKKIASLTEDDIFSAMEKHAQDGIDFMTLHCGITLETVQRLEKNKRLMGVVSRGGAFLVNWIKNNGKENPLYASFDRVMEIAKKYDITLSLGDGMRPGCLVDATDSVQIQELIILGELAKHALENDVQAMLEGPGHVPLLDIEKNIKLQKRLCHNAPFYVLGPIVTDIAPGYDHITSAIGGAIAASYGADFLCYVTPAEHLRLPSLEDVKEGVIAAKIAAHTGDISKGIKGAIDRDIEISKLRKQRKWQEQIKVALDQEKAASYRKDKPLEEDICTMCSDYCSLKVLEDDN